MVTTEVPKVTGICRLAPSSGRSDQPVGHQAKPEVDNGAEIEVETMMSRNRRQRWQQEKVDHVA